MATAEAPVVYEDATVYETDRYAIYRVSRSGSQREEIATTSKEGIGTALVQLRFPTEAGEEPSITNDDRVGIRDRLEHKWVVNPYAVGR